jgi:uncharacterized protein YdeI (YjbR/CyaY-like superfamily)
VNRPLPIPTIFPTAADFRTWLEANHDSVTELWVGYYKKGVLKTSMTYREAVEEALCFGWIDGQARTISHEVHANRFTPRRKGSSWSAINIARVAELRAAGRMHPAGIRAFEERDRRKDASHSYETEPKQLPPEMEQRLRANEAAWAHWQAERPSYRRAVVHWLHDAKREETRERRLAALIEDSAAGRPIKPFSYFRRTDQTP